jgi:hypothetical protein
MVEAAAAAAAERAGKGLLSDGAVVIFPTLVMEGDGDSVI